MDQTGRELMRVDTSDAIDGEPVYCEARPVTPEDVGAWDMQIIADAFARFKEGLDGFIESIRPMIDDLVAILADDPNVRARERSRADVAEKRRMIRREMTPPPNPLPVATRRGLVRRMMDASPRDKKPR